MGIASPGYHNVHIMLGPPGTAKTTVAGLMGEIMMEEGVIPGSRFACVNGAELKGMYVGHSAPKTKALFDENDIIVIDEAYSLSDRKGEPDSFSSEAIAQLVIEIEEHAADKLVILAGYGGTEVEDKNNRMRDFIDSNPGIKSRINSTFCFKSYSAPEMVRIFEKHAALGGYVLETGFEPLVEQYFKKRVCDSNFGNGREARSLFEKVTVQTAGRVMKLFEEKADYIVQKEDVSCCTLEDVRRAIERAEKEHVEMAGKTTALGKIGF